MGKVRHHSKPGIVTIKGRLKTKLEAWDTTMGVLGVVDTKTLVYKPLIKLKWAMLMPWPKLSCIGKTNAGCFWQMVVKPTVEEERSKSS